MKVTYTEEQRQYAIKTFKKLKSYTKTIRLLGYPSLHTLYDWVGKRSHKTPQLILIVVPSITHGI